MKAANHHSRGGDNCSKVDGEEMPVEEEGMDVEVTVDVTVEEKEEMPLNPDVDKDSPEVRIQRKQALWFYHR